MKLNKKDRIELRKFVVEELNKTTKANIKIDKNILEMLLFEKITYDKDSKKTLLLPVWSGDFLTKIDLSEIDFSNVAWSLSDKHSKFYKYIDLEGKSKINGYYFDSIKKYSIDFSNTNAVIDFSKSWEAQHEGICIANCNFENIDLSNNDFSNLLSITNSNLKNTHISLPQSLFDHYADEFENPPLYNTNLSNNDLSNLKINASIFFNTHWDFNSCCVLTNTGINILLSLDEINQIKNSRNILEYVRYVLKGNFLVGCFINNKKRLSQDEIDIKREQMRKKYELYKRSIYKRLKKQIKR